MFSGKCCTESWQTVAAACFVIQHMTAVALCLISCSKEYEPKQILTWCSYSRFVGVIWQFESSLLPVWSLLSVNSVNRDKTKLSNMNFLYKVTIVIPQLPCLFSMAKTVSSTFTLVIEVASNTVNLFKVAICTFAGMCFPIELVPYSDGWRRTW